MKPRALVRVLGVLGAVASLISSSTAAADVLRCTSTLTQVLQWNDGHLSVVGPGFAYAANKSVTLCTASSDARVCNNYFAVAQAALLSGKQVRIALDVPANTTCTSLPERPVVTYVSLFE